ncbi:MAG: putative transposase [Enterobacterales bacterium]|jgi:putative transposase
MDLTFLTSKVNDQTPILGIIEHQSRLSISLTQLKTKSTINILRALFDAIELFGNPESIRTDNESMFTSCLFRTSCWLLGIRHQKSDKGCPWQNGRIERFFGSFKSKLKLLPENIDFDIQRLLIEYRCWYNHLRPHDYLDGSTPAEVFTRRKKSTTKQRLMIFWKGNLAGDYYPPT